MDKCTDNRIDISPARRVSNVSEYYFSKKLKEIADMNARGLDIISLGIGSPDQPPHSDVIAALTEDAARPDTHGYQPYVGIAQLREAFAEWYAKWFGVKLNPSKEIQPLIGSKEGVLHVSLAFLNPGDGVLVPNPGYPTYNSVSSLVEANIITYNLKEKNDWLPDFEEIEKNDLSGVKLMWVNYPNMPTGRIATLKLFEDLVSFGKRHNIVIVNDNPYSFILNDEQLSILSVPGAKDICIELNSMSKSHNMPGWRVGMLASNADFVAWVLRVKSNIDSGTFHSMQIAAVKALAADESWYKEINNI
ncbi:MAG: aminotransferase class I/II-fold pyridoxal phosphate-dependent enzyme, partial [Bacteroidales bacterium]